jgi:protein LSM14
VTFEDPFDFEKSNEEMKNAMEKLKLEEQEKTATDNRIDTEDSTEETKKEDPVIYYDKDKFFDNISCEALERAQRREPRQDWFDERKLNSETFGVPLRQSNNYRNNYRGRYGRGDYGSGRGGGGFYRNGNNRNFNNNRGYNNRYRNNWNNGGGNRDRDRGQSNNN